MILKSKQNYGDYIDMLVFPGTFAVVCMMASKPVLLYSTPPESHQFNSTSSHTHSTSPDAMYTPIQVATVVCLVVGIWQVDVAMVLNSES